MKELTEAALKQGELWGRAVRDWVEIQEPLGRPLWLAALDATAVGPETRLLDAGCGAGGACELAAARGAVTTGIDPSVPMITVARERLPLADFRVGELEDLPFSNAAFDAAIAVNSLQFVANPPLALHELRRVCRPEGRIAAVVFGAPEECDLRAVFEAILALYEKPPSGRGPFALSYPSAIEDLFAAVKGLKLNEIQPVDCTWSYPDLETAVRGQMSTGPSQRAGEFHGAMRVADAIRTALEPFLAPDGRVLLNNRFCCAIGTAQGA